jgi:hypothetical protein
MVTRINRIILSVLMLMLLISGCTRESSEVSKLKLVLPSGATQQKVGALGAESMLSHLIINVSGEGIPSPIVFNWDACENDCDTPMPAPPAFVLDVPMGNNRMVQVLAVYSDSSDIGEFYYGDAVQSLLRAEESVVINLSSFATGVDLSGDGRVAGRYLPIDNFGPTGELYVTYTPPGKPGLILEKSQMIAGWFQAFALKNVAFDYVLANGPVVLSQFSMSSATVNSQVAKVIFPNSYERQKYENNASSWVSKEGSENLIGFFGPGAASKRVCYQNLGYSFNNYAVAGSGGSTKLQFQNANAASASIVAVSGGQSCSSADVDFENSMIIDPARFDGNGSEAIAGFSSAFKMQVGSSSTERRLALVTSANMGDRMRFDIRMSLLPGVMASGIDRVIIFKRTSDSEMHFKGDGPPCLAMQAGMVPGAIRAGEFPITALSMPVELFPAEQNKTDVFLCLTRGAMLSPMGVSLWRWNFQGSSSGTGGGTVNPPGACTTNCSTAPNPTVAGIGFMRSGEPSNAIQNSMCTKLEVYASNSTGQEVTLAAGSTINYSLKKDNVTLIPIYDNMNCSGTPVTEKVFSGGSNRQIIYINHTGSPGMSFSISSSINSANPVLPTPNYIANKNFMAVSGSQKWLYVTSPPSGQILPDQCYYAIAAVKDMNFNPAPVSAQANFNLSLTGGVQVFGDAGCTLQMTMLTVTMNSHSSGFWFKVPATVTSGQVQVNFTEATTNGILPQQRMLMISNSSAVMSKLSLAHNNVPRMANECSAIGIQPANTDGIPLQHKGAAISYSLTKAAGPAGSTVTFYSEGSCTTQVASPMSLPSGASLTVLFAKFSVAGQYTLQTSSTSLSLSVQETYNVFPPSGGSVISVANSTLTPAVTSLAQGTTMVATLQLRDSSNNPVVPGSNPVFGFNSTGAGTITTGTVSNNGNGNYSVQITGASLGTLNLKATVDGVDIISSSISIVAGGGSSVSVANSSITVLGGPNFIVNTQFTVRVELRNSSNQLVAHSSSNPNISLSGGASLGTITSRYPSLGVYEFDLSVTAPIANTQVSAVVDGLNLNPGPVLNIVDNNPSAQYSFILPPPTAANAGTPVTFQVQLKNSSDLNILNGPDHSAQISFTISGGAGSMLNGGNPISMDLSQGVYTYQFQKGSGGSDNLQLRIGGVAVSTPQRTVALNASALSMPHSMIDFIGGTTFIVGQAVQVRFWPKDNTGVVLPYPSNLSVVISVAGGSVAHSGVQMTAVAQPDGSYIANFSGLATVGNYQFFATVGGSSSPVSSSISFGP